MQANGEKQKKEVRRFARGFQATIGRAETWDLSNPSLVHFVLHSAATSLHTASVR